MSRSLLWAALFMGLMVWSRPALADDDPIKTKLDEAKAAFDKEMDAFRSEVAKWFDEREDAARKRTNKKLVDQIKAAREGFEQTGELPQAAPAKIKRKHTSARSSMESAYDRAMKAYVAAKMDEKADAIEKEKAEFVGRNSEVGKGENWVQLFNGRDILRGWSIAGNPATRWYVRQGILYGESPVPAGVLYTTNGNYRNFRFRVETMLSGGPNSSMNFRWTPNKEVEGYRAFIGGTDPDARSASGDLYLGMQKLADAPDVPIEPGVWFTQEVIVRGNLIKILIDGKKVVEYVDGNHNVGAGHLGLMCRGTAKVAFRKIEVCELPE